MKSVAIIDSDLFSQVKYDKYEEKPCENSIGGGVGVCKYLTDCEELDQGFKDLTMYLSHSCDSNGYGPPSFTFYHFDDL